MLRGHKIRLYPTEKQEIQLLKTAGASRYVYNWGLCEWQKMWKAVEEGKSNQKPSAQYLSRKWTQIRPKWSYKTYRGSQTQALLNLGRAFQNLWRGISNYPKPHKKGQRDTFYVDNAHAYIVEDHIVLPKIGSVKMAERLRFDGKIMGYTISTYAGEWYVGVRVELKDVQRECLEPSSVVGIDVGLKHIAVTSEGEYLDAPDSIKRLDTGLKNCQRALSRAKKGSNNYRKLLLKKQKKQNRINNIHRDIVHKFTARIAKNHGIVVVEDLDIEHLRKHAESKSKRRALGHSMMGIVIEQLSYRQEYSRK